MQNRMVAQQRLTAISQLPNGGNKASILSFADSREASEESALYGTPDEIAAKVDRLRAVGVEYVLITTSGNRAAMQRFARDVMPAYLNAPRQISSARAEFVRRIEYPERV